MRDRCDAVMRVDEIDRFLEGIELERLGTKINRNADSNKGVVLPRKRSKES
jgi:hypothetical protein